MKWIVYVALLNWQYIAVESPVQPYPPSGGKELRENVDLQMAGRKSTSVEIYLNDGLFIVSIHRENLENTAGCEQKLLIGITPHDAHQFSRST